MKKLDFSTADLPAEFSLEAYEQCATWGVDEWFRALAYRYPIVGFSALSPEDLAEDDDNPDMLEYLQDAWRYLLKNPLPEVSEEDRIFPARASRAPIRDLTGADYFDGLFKIDKWDYQHIAPIARRACQRAEVIDFERIDDEMDGHRAFIELDLIPAWKIHRDANAPEDSFCIEVDLGASDDHLVREFKAWLKKIRKDTGLPQIPKQFGPDNFADWNAKRLLPYIDLINWAMVHGGTLSLPVLGYALFPDEPMRVSGMRDIESVIRRTTAPQARALCSLEVVSTLSRQRSSAA